MPIENKLFVNSYHNNHFGYNNINNRANWTKLREPGFYDKMRQAPIKFRVSWSWEVMRGFKRIDRSGTEVELYIKNDCCDKKWFLLLIIAKNQDLRMAICSQLIQPNNLLTSSGTNCLKNICFKNSFIFYHKFINSYIRNFSDSFDQLKQLETV